MGLDQNFLTRGKSIFYCFSRVEPAIFGLGLENFP